MRNIVRGLAAVALVLLLATTSVSAATRSSRSSSGILQTIQRFFVRVASRISPPGGIPTPAPEEPTTTTTDEPTKSQ